MIHAVHRARLLLTLAAASLLASCGGGSSKTDQPVTELSASDNAVLSGDWPQDTPTRAFIVRNDEEWQAAWQDRKATLNCESYADYNRAACAADSPPAIDFSKYSLVGLLLNPVSYFKDPTPDEVFLDDEDHNLVVRYSYSVTYHVPAQLVTGTRFFLVPATDLPLDAEAKDVTPH
jgi:hypothetical protein